MIPALALALAAAAPAGAAAAGGVRMLAPAADSIVSGSGVIHVIVDIDAAVPPFSVRLSHQARDAGPGTYRSRERGGGVLHWAVQLGPGENTVEVAFDPPDGPAVRETRSVFHFSQIQAAVDPPRRFKRLPFHGIPAAQSCAECHTMQAAPGDAAPSAPEQSTCYGCHARLTKVKEVHGPAALWACTRCHEPSASPRPYATPEPVMPLCFGCHQEQKDRFYGNRYQHGPTATGFCTICHNPHGSEQGFFLKKAAWELCTTCHFEKGTGRHVVSWGPRGQSHPTRGRPDPTRVNRELSCASCHNPHAAPGAKLWNFNATVYLDLCRNCHRGIVGG